MGALQKLCVFCGKDPVSKTKEHVVPKWLMAMTGDLKRTAHFQVFQPHGPGRNREFSFDAYHFPACDACNNEFSDLEGNAKEVVEKLVDKAEIGQGEWVTLLDWLDKVRVGIWLGTRYLDKNYVNIVPLFHIADRIGTKDRSVIVVRAKQGHRLSFFGSNSLAFRLMPSCFGVLINDIGLVNVSTDFLLSRRLGFPYAADMNYEPDGLLSYVPLPGRERIMRPPLMHPVAAFGTAIHQCMFRDWQKSVFPELWKTDYVLANSRDHNSGESSLFMEKENGSVMRCSDTPSSSWVPRHMFNTSAAAGQYLARICFDLQEKLLLSRSECISDKERRIDAVKLEKLLCKELRAMRLAIPDMQ